MMSAIRNCIFVVILCCLHGITMSIVKSNSSKESETIEIAPISSDLFTDISVGRNELSTEINLPMIDGNNKETLNGLVLIVFLLIFTQSKHIRTR